MLALDQKTKTMLFVIFLMVAIGVAAYFRFGGSALTLQPHGPTGPIPAGIKVVDPKLQAGPFTCPSTPEFCQLAATITKDRVYSGFGAAIATNSPVLATFDGHLTSTTAIMPENLGGEKITIAYLDSAQRYLRTVYYFKGSVNKTDVEIKEGEELGKTGGAINYYDGVTLLIQIIKNEVSTGEKIKLTSQDFK